MSRVLASPRLTHAACAITLLLTTLLAYANSLDAEFVYDDFQNFVHNPRVHWHDLTWQSIIEGVLGGPTPRPVSIFTFGLNSYLGGQDVFGYHLFNVLLHATNSVGVYALLLATLRLSLRDRRGAERPSERRLAASALVGALLFALHPLQTQAVTYVVQRMTALATGFYLASFLFYVHVVRDASGWRRGLAWFGLGLGYALSVGSKEIGTPLPVALWLYEWIFGRGLDRGWARRQVGWLLLPLAAGLALFAGLYEAIQAEFDQRGFTMGERVLTELRVVWFYLSLVVAPLPSRQSLLQLISTSHSLIDPISTLLSAVALVGLLGFASWLAPRRPVAAFGVVWFLLHLVVESSVLPLELIYEHRIYLPLIGFSLIVADGLTSVSAARARAAFVLSAVVLATLGGLTHARNEIWRRADTIWQDVLAKTGDQRARESVAWALESRGFALMQQGRERDALAYFRQAAQVAPEYAHNYRSWGEALVRLGRVAPAIGRFRKAIELDPTRWRPHDDLAFALMHIGRISEGVTAYRELLRRIPSDAEGLRAPRALAERGQPREAAILLETAVLTRPRSVVLREELIAALEFLGEDEAATAQLTALLALAPSAEHHGRLGLLLWQRGQSAAAIDHIEAATALDPDDPRHLANLAWMLTTATDPSLQDPERALRLAEPLLRAAPEDADLLDTATTALAALGRWQEATEQLEQAIARQRTAGREASALEERLETIRNRAHGRNATD